MPDRILPFEGVENFRDYGDYATIGGARLARGRLLRSGHHARASDADLARFAALGVSTVVDLRRRGERVAQPSRRPEAFAGRVLESADAEGGDAPHIVFLKSTDLTPDSVRGFMLETYRALPFDPGHLELFRGYFQALAQDEGAVLIHCAAGKDRTGVLAALTHALLGVHEDDLMADYLLTNTAVRLEARAPEIAEILHRTYGRRPSLAAVHAFLGVEPGFLAAALSEIATRHGGVEPYLERVVCVTPEARAKIERNLLS